jgi:hypothetical protein
VSGGQNGVGVQERSSAEVAAALLDADDEGEVSLGSGGSANDGLIGELSLRELGVLRNGRSSADRGDRKGNEDVFELHLEVVGGAEACWKVSIAKVRAKDWFANEGQEVIFVLERSPS